jgi:NADH dehydrogenase
MAKDDSLTLDIAILGGGFAGVYCAKALERCLPPDQALKVGLISPLDLFFARDLNVLNPRFSRVLKEMHLEAGDVLFHKGEPVFSFYIVKAGRIELFDEQGVVQTVSGGEYFGERALLGDRQWFFSARAVQPTTLVALSAATFRQLVQGSGSLGRLFRGSAAKYQSREVIAAMVQKISPAARQVTARELMTRQLRVFHPDMTLREAIPLTKENPHSAYPVVDGDGRPLGVVSREEFYEFLKQPDTTLATPVRRMPMSVLPTVGPDAPLPELMERLIRAGANKLLVVDPGGRLQGIITMIDLVTVLHAERAPAPAAGQSMFDG